MRKLEDGSIEVDSAYEANRLAIANGFNRDQDDRLNGLSLDDKPTLAINNEVSFFNKSVANFNLTAEAQRSKLRFLNDADSSEPSWYGPDWNPPASWADSGLTPPGQYEERAIVIGPDRANIIELVLEGISKGLSLRELRSQPYLENFRPDLASSAQAGEALRISKAEASFMLGLLSLKAEFSNPDTESQAA